MNATRVLQTLAICRLLFHNVVQKATQSWHTVDETLPTSKSALPSIAPNVLWQQWWHVHQLMILCALTDSICMNWQYACQMTACGTSRQWLILVIQASVTTASEWCLQWSMWCRRSSLASGKLPAYHMRTNQVGVAVQFAESDSVRKPAICCCRCIRIPEHNVYSACTHHYIVLIVKGSWQIYISSNRSAQHLIRLHPTTKCLASILGFLLREACL